MLRECTLEEISDGKTYGLNDMVKADTGGCTGCHKCCTGMGSSIVLDPYDICQLKQGLGKAFQTMLDEKIIELNIVDGLILPNLCMGEKDACSLLDENMRCSIHDYRPGICRLFPLGRVYTDSGFSYFLQKNQCAKQGLAKIKVKKWIDIADMASNEEYILAWHNFIRRTGELMLWLRDNARGEHINDIAMYVLNEFYVKDIQPDMVYTVCMEKIKEAEKNIDTFRIKK